MMQSKSHIFSPYLLTWIFILLAGSGQLSAQSRSVKTTTLPLVWQGDSIQNRWEPHTALLIPIKLKYCPRLFYMQFDLGSPYTLLYKHKLLAIQSRFPRAIQLNETTEKINQLTFISGKTTIQKNEIPVRQFDNDSINWSNKNEPVIIGTFGADLIDGQVAIIDYPGKTLTLSDTLINKPANLRLTEFIYTQKRILLPAILQGESTLLYFDTGSSMFELLTDKTTAVSLTKPESQPIQFNVNSWGNTLTANNLPAASSIEINGQQIPLQFVTYMDGVSSSQTEQMKKMGIGGMTGNKLFLCYKLVLDTRNSYFGLIPVKESNSDYERQTIQQTR